MNKPHHHVNLYIVVADDDIEDHELIKKAVRECDVNSIVTSVYNGQQLMDLLLRKDFYKTDLSKKPDVIILDLKMPIMSGSEALEQIKSNPDLDQIPIYILTGSNNHEERSVSGRLGVQGFYPKPVEYGDLSRLIGNICSAVK
jgi:CheY-like chemotaxis protein